MKNFIVYNGKKLFQAFFVADSCDGQHGANIEQVYIEHGAARILNRIDGEKKGVYFDDYASALAYTLD